MPVGKRRVPPPTKRDRLLPSIESTQRSLSGDVDSLRRDPVSFGGLTAAVGFRSALSSAARFTPIMIFPQRPFKTNTLLFHGAAVSGTIDVGAAIYRLMMSDATTGRWVMRKVVGAPTQVWNTSLLHRQFTLDREITFDGKSGMYWVGISLSGSVNISAGHSDGLKAQYTHPTPSLASEYGYGGEGALPLTRSTGNPIHARLVPNHIRRILCD